jgi:hypothetical protein
MSASYLEFNWISPADELLNVCIENSILSPIPGNSGPGIFELQSPNINVEGVTLTILFFGNEINPSLPPVINGLTVLNVTISASTTTNVIGTLCFDYQISNTATVKTKTSIVTSASGMFASYLYGNAIRTDENTGKRSIRIFPK